MQLTHTHTHKHTHTHAAYMHTYVHTYTHTIHITIATEDVYVCNTLTCGSKICSCLIKASFSACDSASIRLTLS